MSYAYSYVRVSTPYQSKRHGGTGIGEEEQRRQNLAFYRAMLLPMGIEIADPYSYEDAAVSASKREFRQRPAGRQLMARLRRGDHLVIAKSSRAFRNMSDCLQTEQILNNLGVIIHFLDIGFDTSTANGRLMRGIMALLDQWYSDQLGEKAASIHAYWRTIGHSTGHRPDLKPWGYNHAPNHMLIADPAERRVMEWVMRELHFGEAQYEVLFANLQKMEAQGSLVLGRKWSEKTIRCCSTGFFRLCRREGVDWIRDEQLREWTHRELGLDGRRVGLKALG